MQNLFLGKRKKMNDAALGKGKSTDWKRTIHFYKCSILSCNRIIRLGNENAGAANGKSSPAHGKLEGTNGLSRVKLRLPFLQTIQPVSQSVYRRYKRNILSCKRSPGRCNRSVGINNRSSLKNIRSPAAEIDLLFLSSDVPVDDSYLFTIRAVLCLIFIFRNFSGLSESLYGYIVIPKLRKINREMLTSFQLFPS